MASYPGWARVLGVLLLLGVAWVAHHDAQAPAAKPLDAPASEFSGLRALEHSKKFAVEPRPAGGPAARRGRDYLIKTLREMGLEVENQQAPLNQVTSVNYADNVLARIPGTANTGALVMTAHYDSVAWGPGAADDGSGTVVMLELARALKTLPPMKNDIVFDFTSGEERGRASAIVSMQHAWLQNMNILLGFEGRGTYGPAYMFETSEGNYPIIKELAGIDLPVNTHCIMYEVHRRTPNSTDFTGMAQQGAIGYNVAFVGGLGYYHTANDRWEHLSPETLQHQGEYGLALAKHYGNFDRRMEKGEDAVFFTLPGHHMVAYPAGWSRVVTAAAVLAVLIGLALSAWAGQVRVVGLLFALGAIFGAAAVSAAVGWGFQLLGYRLFYVYLTYNAWYYHISTMLIAAAFLLWALRAVSRWSSAGDIFGATALIWLAAAMGLEYYLPIGSYVTAWPALLGGVALALVALLARRGADAGLLLLVLVLGAVPALSLAVPGLSALYYQGAALTPVPNAVLTLLVLAMASPSLLALLGARAPRAGILVAALGVVVLLMGWSTNGFTAEKPKFGSLSYALNLDTGQAAFASTDAEPDFWTSQFFTKNPRVGDIRDVCPEEGAEVLRADAPVLPLAAPELTVLSDNTVDGKRHLTIRYHSPREVEEARIRVLPPTRVLSAHLVGAGELLADQVDWSFNISVMSPNATCEFELVLDAAAGSPCVIRITEDQYSLPDLTTAGYTPRPANNIPKPNTIGWWESNRLSSHHNFVTKSFSL